MTTALTRDDRDFLKAVVALHLAGQTPVDGANDPREFAAGDWVGALETTRLLVRAGMLQWADPESARIASDEGATFTLVVPTALGIYETLV